MDKYKRGLMKTLAPPQQQGLAKLAAQQLHCHSCRPGHRVEVRLHVEQPRQGWWLAPALVLLVALAGLGTMTGRRWVRV